MALKYRALTCTESVCRAQARYYGQASRPIAAPERDPLGEPEAEFIAARDSFYLATINENGWPYVQHRGGPPGFLKVVSASRLVFADYAGNRQLLSTGNLAANDRVALLLMDYPRRERLKILGRARVEEARHDPALHDKTAVPNMHTKVERVIVIDVVSFDWNCPQHIIPRYSLDEIERLVSPLKARIAELEAQLRSVKA